jgi:hypothetical protein
MVCAKNSAPEILEKLITHGADIKKLCSNGQSLLHIAIGAKNTNIAKCLLKHNTDFTIVYIKDQDGMTAFKLAAFNGMDEILAMLISSAKEHEKFVENCQKFDLDIEQQKLSSIVKFLVNEILTSTLEYANFGGHEKCIKLVETALNLPKPTISTIDKTSKTLPTKVANITQKEESSCTTIEKQIHKYYQSQKAILAKTNGSENQCWSIDKQLFNSDKNVVEVPSIGCSNYFAIDKNLATTIQSTYGAVILKKFESAMLSGFVGAHGKSGVKNIANALYELKIFSSTCGDLRLYTNKEYINQNGKKLIVFTDSGNHQIITDLISRGKLIQVKCLDLLVSPEYCQEEKKSTYFDPDNSDLHVAGECHGDLD